MFYSEVDKVVSSFLFVKKGASFYVSLLLIFNLELNLLHQELQRLRKYFPRVLKKIMYEEKATLGLKHEWENVGYTQTALYDREFVFHTSCAPEIWKNSWLILVSQLLH